MISLLLTLAFANGCEHTKTEFRCVEYVRNYDADTITVNIPGVHPLIGDKISIRVFGIDTPEVKTKDSCEKLAANRAKDLVTKMLLRAKRIDLVDVQKDKYFRILAKVKVDGVDLGQTLIDAKMAYPYFGDTKQKRNWCNTSLHQNEFWVNMTAPPNK